MHILLRWLNWLRRMALSKEFCYIRRVKSKRQSMTQKVKGIYDNLMKDLNLKPDSVALLAGETVNADQGGACAGMNSFIAKLPQAIPNSYVIPSSGCAGRPDHLHFTAAGYREFGKRYAVKMLHCWVIRSTYLKCLKLQM